MQNLLHPDHGDLLRETILILFGIIARWIELRKLKKKKHD
jgi:hypothetical protein